jgi:hypothetical protein
MSRLGNEYIWVFSGDNSKLPSAVFTEKEKAEEWIKKYTLSGMLTAYPVNKGTYDWAISHNYFNPKKEHETSAEFIQRFSSALQEHHHYENGVLEEE